jgi:hypothetical protein
MTSTSIQPTSIDDEFSIVFLSFSTNGILPLVARASGARQHL